jgi:thiol-disulfide isomerase/thioredoxin
MAVFLYLMKKLLLIAAVFCVTATLHAQHISKWKMTDLVKYMNQKTDTIFVINFWATFCKPCVAEIPDFINVANKYKSQKVKLLLVSLDLPSFYPAKIAAFAAKHKFAASMVWLNETNADYFCPLIDSGWSGAIPATVIVNAKTGYKNFFEAEMTGEELEGELTKVIGENKTSMVKPKFYMPMNEVVSLKYYDKNNHLCNDYPYSPVVFKSNDSSVYSVEEGYVTTVVNIDGMKVVIIKKDKLFYTYSNLKNVLVKKGMKVKSDQMIGYAAVDLDGKLSIDFYLNDEKETIRLTKSNFKPRVNDNLKDHSFDPVDPE